MGTSSILQQVLILIIPWITNGFNTYTSDGDTYWKSTSNFVPVSSGEYGTIRLRQHIRMKLNIQWNGRTSQTLAYEQIFRIGWAATTGSCSAQNSRYPSLWIDNMDDVFHLSISQDDSCGEGWRISSYPLEKGSIYKVHIEFTDSRIFMIINDTIVLDQIRTAPTRSSFIGNLMNVYIASDHWEIPYIITDASLWNIDIRSLVPPTPAPTILPTLNPTSNPTHAPSIHPTPIPTMNPTHTPSLNPTHVPTMLPSAVTTTPTQRPTLFMLSPTTERPTVNPTTMNPTTILVKTNVSMIIKFQTNVEHVKEMKMSEILIVLITGIVSCLIFPLLIFIAFKKCGDIRKGNALSAQRLGLALRKIKVNTDDSFSNKNKVCVPLKPAAEPDILRLAPPHPVPAPAENYIIKVSNPMENVYDVIDEGNETSNDTQNETETENETQIMGIDGIEEEETILTQTESMTMSPSHPASRLNTTIRNYLMSESNEEEYINAVLEQAVVIHKTKTGNRGLLVINDDEDLDEKIDVFNHNEDMRENIEILDEDNSDDETLPVLPGTATTGTTNDGESLTMDCEDGYQWVTMVAMQIDNQDWRNYVENFKRNKVTESRLCDLKRSDLKELIPKIGPRNEFEKLLRDKLGPERSVTYIQSEF